MARRPKCEWLERDTDGRPRCEHGWATSNGGSWMCPDKARDKLRAHRARVGNATQKRYARSEKGRETQRRYAATDSARTIKALYDLTRIRT